jgi:hypothetical protein
VSEGYTNSVPPQLIAYHGGMAPIDTSAQPGPGASLATPVGQQLFDSMDINMDLQRIYDLANKNNVAIYTIDPRGLATSEFGLDLPPVDRATDRQYLSMTSDTLRSLSENSDGRAIVNRNDMTLAMKQIVTDSSAYYLLGYNSTPALSDGKFHEINVKVKRPGVQVRHRKGYWALKPEEASRLEAPRPTAAPSPVETAIAANSVPRSRVIRTWIGTTRGENGRTHVTFVWEPVPRPTGEPVRDADRPARVALTAASQEGETYFRGRVPDAGAIVAAGGAAGAASVSFDAPPGKIQLRLSVEGASAGVIDSEIRDISLPDFTSPQTVLGTPEVFRARTVAELQRLKSDPLSVPAVAREFTRTERLLLRVPVYGPSGAPATLTARLLGRGGQSISDLPVTAPDAKQSAFQFELALANLPPGDYAIALAASSVGGDLADVLAFRIVP